MTLHEFLAQTGLPGRTLRHYHRHGIIPQADLETGYGEVHLLRARAIPMLRAQGVHQLAHVAARLDVMTIEQLRVFVQVEATSHEPQAPGSDAGAIPSGPFVSLGEQHLHIKLADGVVLVVRMPVSDEAQALVHKIVSACGLSASFSYE